MLICIFWGNDDIAIHTWCFHIVSYVLTYVGVYFIISVWLCLCTYCMIWVFLSSEYFIEMYSIVPDRAPWKNSLVLNGFLPCINIFEKKINTNSSGCLVIYHKNQNSFQRSNDSITMAEQCCYYTGDTTVLCMMSYSNKFASPKQWNLFSLNRILLMNVIAIPMIN